MRLAMKAARPADAHQTSSNMVARRRPAGVPRDLFDAWRLAEAAIGADSLFDFVPLATRGYARPDHLRPLVGELYRAVTDGGVRVLGSMPPRHAKTETISHFIAWQLQRDPAHVFAYVTYAAEVAESKSRKMRDIALRMGVKLRPDSTKLSEWRTPQEGGVIATGIGGPLTSHGVNTLIVDDPTKNREEAESATIRARNFDWFTSTAMTRLEPGGSAFVVHTRWHPGDLIGLLAKQTAKQGDARWKYINLPAISTDGRALWPERWPVDALEERREDVHEYDWASLYQGEPRPRGFKLFTEPARYQHADLEGARIVIACDPAATEKTSADFTAIIVMGAKGSGSTQIVYVLDVIREQMEIPRLVKTLLHLQQHWAAPIFIEAVGGFKAVPQMLRHIDPKLRIVDVPPLGDKFTRALPASAAWNAGRLQVPMHAPWLKALLEETQSFTGVRDEHDDQVDALAYGFNAVDRKLEAVRRGIQSLAGGA